MTALRDEGDTNGPRNGRHSRGGQRSGKEIGAHSPAMTSYEGSPKYISLQIHEQAGMVYTVDLIVTEWDKTGTLVVW